MGVYDPWSTYNVGFTNTTSKGYTTYVFGRDAFLVATLPKPAQPKDEYFATLVTPEDEDA